MEFLSSISDWFDDASIQILLCVQLAHSSSTYLPTVLFNIEFFSIYFDDDEFILILSRNRTTEIPKPRTT